MGSDWALLISCEHAGNKIPREYKSFIKKDVEDLLKTHRGWDRGALTLAKEVSRTENAPLYFTELSRLLVDCNRSLNHKSVFGPSFQDVPEGMRDEIVRDFYHPYRQSVIEGIERLRKEDKKVLHCAFHSFTPELNGVLRNAEFGLLYDPGRKTEMKWADTMMNQLKKQGFPWRARRNYPYLGKADGFTKFLRGKFHQSVYAGFELEFNQAVFADPAMVDILKAETVRFFEGLNLRA